MMNNNMFSSKVTACISLILLLMVAQNGLFAQTDKGAQGNTFTSKNTLFGEFSIPFSTYSLNYGRIIHQKDKLKIAVNAGFSMLYRNRSEPVSSYWAPFIPLEITSLWGRSHHHFEIGLGFYATRDKYYLIDENYPNNIKEESYWGKSIVPRIGYRYQRPEGGLFIRAGYTPSFDFESIKGAADKKVSFFPFALGIGIGFSF